MKDKILMVADALLDIHTQWAVHQQGKVLHTICNAYGYTEEQVNWYGLRTGTKERMGYRKGAMLKVIVESFNAEQMEAFARYISEQTGISWGLVANIITQLGWLQDNWSTHLAQHLSGSQLMRWQSFFRTPPYNKDIIALYKELSYGQRENEILLDLVGKVPVDIDFVLIEHVSAVVASEADLNLEEE